MNHSFRNVRNRIQTESARERKLQTGINLMIGSQQICGHFFNVGLEIVVRRSEMNESPC